MKVHLESWGRNRSWCVFSHFDRIIKALQKWGKKIVESKYAGKNTFILPRWNVYKVSEPHWWLSILRLGLLASNNRTKSIGELFAKTTYPTERRLSLFHICWTEGHREHVRSVSAVGHTWDTERGDWMLPLIYVREGTAYSSPFAFEEVVRRWKCTQYTNAADELLRHDEARQLYIVVPAFGSEVQGTRC